MRTHENLDQRKVANLKTLDQASRLCAFFRQVFEDTVIGWKTPQADRISAEQAQEQLMALIEALRAKGITEASLESPLGTL